MAKPHGEVSLVVFSDLDGTLLDHHTYRFDDAEEALLKAVEKDTRN